MLSLFLRSEPAYELRMSEWSSDVCSYDLARGPTYLTYGPILADGDIVFEEWESQIYGANGELYNNQYCWFLRFEGEEVVAMREYNDTHHAALTFGELGKWPEQIGRASGRERVGPYV